MVGNKNPKEEISWRLWNSIHVMAPRKAWKPLSGGENNIAWKPMVAPVLWVSDTVYSVWNQACYTVITTLWKISFWTIYCCFFSTLQIVTLYRLIWNALFKVSEQKSRKNWAFISSAFQILTVFFRVFEIIRYVMIQDMVWYMIWY